MKQVKITTTSDLINGGCNACPNVKCTNYLVHVEDETIALETLTVADLVTLLALKEGFRQKLVMEMFEEYTMFERETHQVVFKEEETRILFQSKKQTIQSTLLSKEPQQVFQETQQILHQLFELEPFEFELVEETDLAKAKSFSCFLGLSFTNFFNDSVINFREGSIGMVIGLDNENFSRSKGLINWLPRDLIGNR